MAERLTSFKSMARRVMSRRPNEISGDPLNADLQPPSEVGKEPPKAMRQLHIPICDSTPEDEECARLRQEGQFLARQDRWSELADRIQTNEGNRTKTPGGMPVAELLSFGARSDVVAAAQHAIEEGVSPGEPAILSGIGGLEAVLSEHDTDAAIALTVALAHIDIGWAWRGSQPENQVPRGHRAAFAAHFDRAAKILAKFDTHYCNSPMLAAAHCAMLPSLRDPNTRVADEYEALIDLDPENERHMRALGNHLLPRWFGTYDQLELEARRTASRTQSIWGDAGYTWVMFDAIANDAEACERVDADFFIDGMKDILTRRPDQATANLLAAYCAVAIASQHTDCAIGVQIALCADWVIRDHLTELHPLVWAHAAQGFDNATPVSSISRFAAHGRAHAYDVLRDLFHDEIAGGQCIVFTPDGLEITA